MFDILEDSKQSFSTLWADLFKDFLGETSVLPPLPKDHGLQVSIYAGHLSSFLIMVSFPWVGFSPFEGVDAILKLFDGHLVAEGNGLFLFLADGPAEECLHLGLEPGDTLLNAGDLFCDSHDQISLVLVGLIELILQLSGTGFSGPHCI